MFGLFEEVFDIVDGGEAGFTEVNGYVKIAGEDLCKFAVDVLLSKGFPPVALEFTGFLFRVVGNGAVNFLNADVDGFSLEG